MKITTIYNKASFIDLLISHGITKGEDIGKIMLAYKIAKDAHRGQYRDGGERYFEHPRKMAIMAIEEFGIKDTDLICGIFLHDVGEDTDELGSIKDGYDAFVTSASEYLTPKFSQATSTIVINMTKPHIDGKMFLNKSDMMSFYTSNMTTDVRSIICKQLDRLHNLRSLNDLNDEKRVEKNVKETKEVLLPMFEKAYTDVMWGSTAREINSTIISLLNKMI